ncbi:hypothetical protein GALMADRAFT_250837 [Galerina marginata CBS 339.88]|uniref:N-acetyltransferase domain-containing protein n=1 Tax=Galerina marginata (strain CBS 339.88) TaxID=685588 RepID=A0A067T2C4_GALM3|nr:hypothetical protein GALMADRAFT_250837 [Galerina marginata CBS 339.88]
MSKSLQLRGIELLVKDQLTDEIFATCANLFSDHYGVWATNAPNRVHGARVKMNAKKLRESVSAPAQTVLAMGYVENQHIGHAFATVWPSEAGRVGWITQLVVHKDFRRRKVATQLINKLKNHPLLADISVVGIASSQPASCAVLAKFADVEINSIDTSFIQENAEKVIRSSPIEYVKTAELRGSLFRDEDIGSGIVSSVDTQFYVDHGEPLEALKEFKSKGPWRLGDLQDGHEFLVMAPAKKPHSEKELH